MLFSICVFKNASLFFDLTPKKQHHADFILTWIKQINIFEIISNEMEKV